MEEVKKIYSDYGSIINFLLIITATALTAYFLSKYLQRKIIDKAVAHQVDSTSFIFVKHMIIATVYFLGFGWAFLALPVTRSFAHSLIAGAGATTLILGFASQQLFTNIISGVFLVINRPFKINDSIEFQGARGKVVEINLNATILEDENNNRIIIPSSLLLSDKITRIQTATETSDK